jgi:PAS domain S-box-containing protein
MKEDELLGIVVSLREALDRRRAAGARTWQAAIVNCCGEAIISKTLDGVINSWNPGATRLFGFKPDEIIGSPITTIVPQELQAQEAEIRARIRCGEHFGRFNTARLAKDGRRIDMEVLLSPINDDERNIVGISMIGRDTSPTERKLAERILRDIDARTSEFASTFARALRDPLTPIHTSVELLRGAEDLQPELRAVATILGRQVQEIIHVVDNLIDGWPAGQDPLQRKMVKLAAAPLSDGDPGRSGGGRRVVIADCNHDSAISLSMLIAAMGHETRIAHDGQETLQLADESQPDMVILDLEMPNLDGLDAARKIARRPWAHATWLVALASQHQAADCDRAREAGFHYLAMKPISADALRQLLGETNALRSGDGSRDRK